MAVATAPYGLARGERGDRVRLGWRDDLITTLVGLWLLAGLFVDGWAHLNRAQLETIFTPWHALFYSGYAANVGWLSWLILRERRAGRVGLAAVPQGYGLGLVGAIVFGVGGVGDLLWHLRFGIEQNREAQLSPTHLLLFVGLLLILTSPLRAAWASPDPREDAPSLRAFLPALLSLAAAGSIVAFMNGYLWGLAEVSYTRRTPYPVRDLNLAQVLITNALLLAPLLLMLRRWRPPFGSVTILFGTTTILMHAALGVLGRYPERAAIVLATGLIADVLIRLLRPWPDRPAALRLFATVAPLTLWAGHFLVVRLRFGIAWEPELWSGIIVVAGLSGLGLSLLSVPPRLPAHCEAASNR